jgi:hypothetical protein
MGWLSDLWNKITGYIASAIRATIFYIQKTIELAKVIINIWKYKLRMKIAGWLQDDTATIILAIALVAIAIFASLVKQSAWFTKLMVSIQVAKADFKNREQSIEGILAFQMAYAVHRLSLVFFPQYQKMIGDLRVSVSAFMEVIGEPVRTASILLESGRALVYAGYTLAGMEDNFKEAAWLSGVQTWLEQTGERIGRYTRNPELIFHDIWMEVIQPNLEIPNKAMSTIYTTLHGLSNNAITFTDNLDNFRQRLDDFTEAMPDEIQALVESRLSPVTDRLDEVLDEVLIPLTDKVDEGFAVIDQMVLDNEIKIVKLAGKIDDPTYLLELINKLSGDRRDTALKLFALLVMEKEYIAKQRVFDIIDAEYEAAMKLQKERLAEPIADKVTTVERADFSVLIGQIKYSKDSWFVGEH